MSDKSISIPLPEWNASVLLESVTTMLYQWLDYLFIYILFTVVEITPQHYQSYYIYDQVVIIISSTA